MARRPDEPVLGVWDGEDHCDLCLFITHEMERENEAEKVYGLSRAITRRRLVTRLENRCDMGSAELSNKSIEMRSWDFKKDHFSFLHL